MEEDYEEGVREGSAGRKRTGDEARMRRCATYRWMHDAPGFVIQKGGVRFGFEFCDMCTPFLVTITLVGL